MFLSAEIGRYHVRVLRSIALLLALLGISGSISTSAQQSGLRVLARDGTKQLPTVTQNNQELVALDDLAQAFNLQVREDRLAGGVTVAAGTRSIIITPDQPVVSVSGRLVSLAAPPQRQGSRWLVPLDFLSRALGPALDTRMEVRRGSRLLIVGDMRVPRIGARVDASAAGTTITFEAPPNTSSRIIVDTGRLTVAFEADALEFSAPSVPQQDFLQAIQPGEAPNTLRIVTGPKFAVHRSTTTQGDSGSRLVIDLLPAGAEPPAPPAPTPPPAPVDPTFAIPLPAPGFRTVVIDPGHGGDDAGARGAGGAQEKDVTLLVARRLRTMIESRLGLRVFQTRDDDRLLALDERSAYANSQKADLFISIHANAALGPGIKGAEVYYLGFERSDEEVRQMADSPPTVLPALGGGTRDIHLIMWDTAQARYLDRSATLAAMTEQALRARVEMSPRALQQAPLRVLVGANMPAVLVEIGYLSNAEQEKQLASGAYQDQIAQSLFDAIAQFRTEIERPQPAAPAAPRPPR